MSLALFIYLCSYMWQYCQSKGIQRYSRISPIITSFVSTHKDRGISERANNLYNHLVNAPVCQQFLLPYNGGMHWMLDIHDPWSDKVIWLDPFCDDPNLQDVKLIILNNFIIEFRCKLRKFYFFKTYNSK